MGRTDKEIYRVIDNVNSYYRINSESKKELLLNKYPNAAAAYSLRLLDGYYRGPLVRVRRDDGVEVDVYPDYNNQLSLDSLVTNVPDADDTTTNPNINADATFLKSLQSLGEFVSNPNYVDNGTAVNATVCVWYDQSSNSNDASQATAANQPKIYDSATGSIGSLRFDGSNDYLQTSYNNANNYTAFWAQIPTSGVGGQVIGRGDLSGRHVAGWSTVNAVFLYRQGSTSINASGTAALYLGFALSQPNSSDCRVGYNGSTGTTSAIIGTGTLEDMVIGAERASLLFYGQSDIHEIIIYPSDQSANRTGIEEDINNHYQIDGYTPPPKLIDLTQNLAVHNGGTTADGTPAAAYSLRLLSSTYNGPLVRIRRTIDNTEVDVYPDSDGEFSIYSTIEDGGTELTTGVTGGSTDKTTLHEFLYGQDTDCMVVRWYDQSSGNHATQDVATRQPKIYDSSTGVVTENGKPAVQFDGTDDKLINTSPSGFSGKSQSAFLIAQTFDSSSSNPDFYFNLGDASPSAGTSRGITQEPYLRFATAVQDYNSYHVQNAQELFSLVCPATVSTIDDYDLYKNGSFLTPDSLSGGIVNDVSTGVLSIGTNTNQVLALEGQVQELILYNSDQSSNRTNIESNINQHYNIY